MKVKYENSFISKYILLSVKKSSACQKYYFFKIVVATSTKFPENNCQYKNVLKVKKHKKYLCTLKLS